MTSSNTPVRVSATAAISWCSWASAAMSWAEPNTWREILEAMRAREERRIAVQEYGKSNTALIQGLRDLFPMSRIVGWKYELVGSRADVLAAAIRQLSDSRSDACVMNGAAYGGGCEIAAAADFIYASSTARFALTEVTLGIMPGAGGTQNLPRAIGERRAKELILSGLPFTAVEAEAWGLVNRVTEPADLLEATLGIETRLVYLQVLRHGDLVERAKRQQMRTIPAEAKRGDIVDRRGHVLATSVDVGHSMPSSG